jgi:hypothetical protein
MNVYQCFIEDQRPRIYDWERLASDLHGQWRETYAAEGVSYHAGLHEGREETADLLANLPPGMPAEEKLRVLWRFLESALMSTPTADDAGDD